MAFKLCASVVPQHALNQFLGGLPDGRGAAGGALFARRSKVFVKPLEAGESVAAAGLGDGAVNILIFFKRIIEIAFLHLLHIDDLR
jgi:hypothetical protein